MELRHFRYFTAVVRSEGYRQAARHLHVAQAALSQAVLDLEEELGIKLFFREKRRVSLTAEGVVFHAEAVRTLEQADLAVEAAHRAARGEIGSLRIGFMGAPTIFFLPELIRLYRSKYPGVKLSLDELTPIQQENAFAAGQIDIGFTRALTAERLRLFESRMIYQDPLLAALPEARANKASFVHLKDLASEPFVLFHREGAQGMFDTIMGVCNDAGFSPRIEHQPRMMQTVLSLVAAEAGVSIIPASVTNLYAEGVQFKRLRPDDVKLDLVAVWPKGTHSVALDAFLGLLGGCIGTIRAKSERNVASGWKCRALD
jgi:DNA-binding transcriptional LysR family regulator